jgi:hypothetical protein
MRFEYFIVSLVLGLLASAIYRSKGRNPVNGFIAGFFFGPLGLIFALLSSVDSDGLIEQKLRSGELKLCPYCAEPIKAAAIRCKHCLSDLDNRDEKPKRGVSV